MYWGWESQEEAITEIHGRGNRNLSNIMAIGMEVLRLASTNRETSLRLFIKHKHTKKFMIDLHPSAVIPHLRFKLMLLHTLFP